MDNNFILGNTSVEPEIPTSGQIYQETLSTGAKAFIFVPDAEDQGIRATASPILQIYGDVPYTQESALETALSSGIGQICCQERGTAVFINPIGDSWSASDAGSYQAAKRLFSDTTDNIRPVSRFTNNGKDDSGKYAGFYARCYVFALGSGADFVYEHLCPGVEGPGVYVGRAMYKPAGIFLAGPQSTLEADVSLWDSRPVPAVLVNASPEVYRTLQALNGAYPTLTWQAQEHSSFPQELLLQAYHQVLEHYMVRVQCSVGTEFYKTTLMPLQNFQVKRFKERHNFEDGASLNYYVWTGGETEGRPLVIMMHGSGSCAENVAWNSGFDSLAVQHNFTLVSLENYANFTEGLTKPEKLMEAIRSIIVRFKADVSRIYIAGFSMGSMHAWMLASNYPREFAGMYCMNYFEKGIAPGGFPSPVPFFASSGRQTHLPEEFPTPQKHSQLEALFRSWGREIEYDGTWIWGVKPDRVREVAVQDLPELTMTIHEFNGSSCDTRIVLASCSLSGHEALRCSGAEAWSFLSRFARNSDGSLDVAGTDS